MRVRLLICIVFGAAALSWIPGRAQNLIPPAPYDYALMSQLAYNPNGHERDDLFARGWRELIRSRADGQNDSLGYFGLAYINRRTRQVVIAHRGTDQKGLLRLFSRSTDLDDDLALLRGQVPEQFQRSVLVFSSRVYARLNTDGILNYTVSHTGHSLGAALAELSAVTEPVTEAVTFDSPGLMYEAPSSTALIISYVGAPNFVNTANRHLGDVILVDVDWLGLRTKHFPRPLAALVSPSLFLTSYLSYSLEAHSMDRILRNFDRRTGEPRRALDVVRWWPLGVLASLRNYIIPGEMPGIAPRSRGGEALEYFLLRLKAITSNVDFQNLVDEYVIRSQRFKDNLSDLYSITIINICAGENSCIIQSTQDCFIDDISLSVECVRDYAA
jgi:hypothetical protein